MAAVERSLEEMLFASLEDLDPEALVAQVKTNWLWWVWCMGAWGNERE